MPEIAQRQSLSDRLADQIRQAIIDARFTFGEPLSEENLAEAFNVSRTPIRKALGILQMEDLVTVVPKSGTYVFTPTLEDISELCDYRAGLEIQAARLSMRENSAALSDKLSTIVDDMESVCRDNNMQAYGQLDTSYHLTFFAFCDNRYLEHGYRMILGRVAALRTQLAVHTEGEPDRSFSDHKALIALVRGGQLAETEEILLDHIQRTKDNYLKAFKRTSETPPSGLAQLRRKLGI